MERRRSEVSLLSRSPSSRRTRLGHVAAAAALLLALTAAAGAQETPAGAEEKPMPPPTAEQVERWAGELDSDAFETRENATVQLAKAGMAAIEPVKKVLEANHSLEATTRSLHVLRELGLSPDLDVQEAARAALEDLARKPSSVGRRATTAIAWLNEQRSVHTADALEKLGAIVNRSMYASDPFGPVQSISSVQIDDNWKGTPRDFRRLKWLQGVDLIVLVGDKINDEIIPHVAAMPEIKRIHFYRTKITSQGLATIAPTDSLSEVGIYYTPIDDSAMNWLKSLTSARSLKLYATKVSPEAKEQLAAALPQAEIDYRRGAFLGVGCAPIDQECMLSTVHEGSPADKAGLRVNDILVKFAGEGVTDFKSLTAVISKYGAGDEVEVEYQRDTSEGERKTFKTKVKLAEWNVDLIQQQRTRP